MKLFKQSPFNEVIYYVKSRNKVLSTTLAEYLKKSLFLEYRKFLRFIENDYKDKLGNANNKLGILMVIQC